MPGHTKLQTLDHRRCDHRRCPWRRRGFERTPAQLCDHRRCPCQIGWRWRRQAQGVRAHAVRRQPCLRLLTDALLVKTSRRRDCQGLRHLFRGRRQLRRRAGRHRRPRCCCRHRRQGLQGSPGTCKEERVSGQLGPPLNCRCRWGRESACRQRSSHRRGLGVMRSVWTRQLHRKLQMLDHRRLYILEFWRRCGFERA